MKRKDYYALLRRTMVGNLFWKKTIATQFKKGHKGYNNGLDNRLLKKCLKCKKRFKTYHARLKFCSKKCYWSSEMYRGKNSNGWKGGRTKLATKIRFSRRAILWRNKVFERDSWKCRKCDRGGYLEAHHIKNFSEYPKLRFIVKNGISLCKRHHNLFHKMFGRSKNNLYQLKKFL